MAFPTAQPPGLFHRGQARLMTLAEHEAGDGAADDVGGVVDAYVGAARRDHRGDAEVEGPGSRPTGTQQRGGHERRRGVARGEARRPRPADLVGALLLPIGPGAAEERLDDPVDERRLDAEQQREPEGLVGLLVVLQPTSRADHVPDDAEVAQLGRHVEDAVGDGVAAQPVELAVDGGVEGADACPPIVGQLRERRRERRVELRRRVLGHGQAAEGSSRGNGQAQAPAIASRTAAREGNADDRGSVGLLASARGGRSHAVVAEGDGIPARRGGERDRLVGDGRRDLGLRGVRVRRDGRRGGAVRRGVLAARRRPRAGCGRDHRPRRVRGRCSPGRRSSASWRRSRCLRAHDFRTLAILSALHGIAAAFAQPALQVPPAAPRRRRAAGAHQRARRADRPGGHRLGARGRRHRHRRVRLPGCLRVRRRDLRARARRPPDGSPASARPRRRLARNQRSCASATHWRGGASSGRAACCGARWPARSPSTSSTGPRCSPSRSTCATSSSGLPPPLRCSRRRSASRSSWAASSRRAPATASRASPRSRSGSVPPASRRSSTSRRRSLPWRSSASRCGGSRPR